uniref:G-protein coupled receptors family 1 profile domain-containing protein n=1 Tax=Neogobius melanostomus TaxID=47308 RepID=A0A8C6TEM4_9GOBI
MNNSSASVTCAPTTQHLSIPVLMCLVCFVGFLLNVFSLWVFSCRLPSWSAGTILQFNLALSDALVAPVTPLMAVYFSMGNNWRFGNIVCTLMIALLSSQFYGSTVFLTLISFHRYKAVVHYNKSSKMKTKSFIKKLCAAVWVFLLALALVYGFVIPSTKVGEVQHCVLVSVGFLLPLSISASCYIRVTNALTRLNIMTPKSLKAQLKSQRMIRLCLIIFCICFLPMNVIRTTGVVLTKFYPGQCHLVHHIQTAYYSSWIVAGLNCCLDPMLYYFGSQNFRKAFPSLRRNLMRLDKSLHTIYFELIQIHTVYVV